MLGWIQQIYRLHTLLANINNCDSSFFSFFFNVRLMSVLRGHAFFFYPCHNGQWPPTSNDFYSRYYPLHFFLILILEEEPAFPFQCWVLNKGTTGTIFITSLVWRGPWLGIEPGNSRTRCQHSTTRLSRIHLINEVYRNKCLDILFIIVSTCIVLSLK